VALRHYAFPVFATSHSTGATAAPLTSRTQYSLPCTPALRLVPTSDLEALYGVGRARVRTAEQAFVAVIRPTIGTFQLGACHAVRDGSRTVGLGVTCNGGPSNNIKRCADWSSASKRVLSRVQSGDSQ